MPVSLPQRTGQNWQRRRWLKRQRANVAGAAYFDLLKEVLESRGAAIGRKRKRGDENDGLDDSGIGGDIGEERVEEVKKVEEELKNVSARAGTSKGGRKTLSGVDKVAFAATKILAAATSQPLAGHLPCLLAELGPTAQGGRPTWSLDGAAQNPPKFKPLSYHVT
ncbi:hypothetical protein LTR17_000079 [Elasticomyces elasticus]|nr:hypothetical protein LTR17_000079 [Elasticomyces elasticus]